MVAVEADLDATEKLVADLEFRRMFNNPADPNNCFIDIQAGAGGTEACDWASMLLRQYLKYCERKGWKTELLEQTDGDVAGIRSASLKVEGDYAYGFLRTETGVHRLVRKSPFDSSGGRHTSFASLYVYPEIDDSIEVEINPPTCAPTPSAPPAPAASTSTRPTRRSASPTCRPASSCSARATARSTATAPRPWRC
jgi:peptide chain release factor 2